MPKTDPQSDALRRPLPWLPLAVGVIALGLIGIGALILRNRPAQAGGATRGDTTPKLGEVRLEDLPLPAPPERYTPESPATPRPVGPADHVLVGQTYTFTTAMNQPTMLITATEEWTITSIVPDQHVVYDSKTTTQMRMKNPPAGMPPMRPRTMFARGQRYPLGAETKRRAWAGRSRIWRRPPLTLGNPVGEETLDVSGYRFDCKIYLSSGVRSWVSEQFPGLIQSKNNRVTRTLVKITDP